MSLKFSQPWCFEKSLCFAFLTEYLWISNQICHGSRSTSLATLSQLFSFSLAFCMILQTVFFWKSVMGLQHEWCKIRKSYNTFWKQHQHDKSRASQLSFLSVVIPYGYYCDFWADIPVRLLISCSVSSTIWLKCLQDTLLLFKSPFIHQMRRACMCTWLPVFMLPRSPLCF